MRICQIMWSVCLYVKAVGRTTREPVGAGSKPPGARLDDPHARSTHRSTLRKHLMPEAALTTPPLPVRAADIAGDDTQDPSERA